MIRFARTTRAATMTCCSVLAAPAMAVEYGATFDSLFAGSVSEYSSDVTGDDSNAHTNASYVGLNLSVAEGGYKLFGVYQYGFERFNESVPNFPAGDHEREAYGGLSTPFGTVGFGRQASFYRKAGQELDPFYDSSVVGFNGVFAAEGASYGLSNLTNGFNDKTLAFSTPAYEGLSLRASYFMDEASGEDEDYGVGLRYAPTDLGLSAGLEFLDSQGGDAVFGVGKRVSYDAIRVYGRYAWEALSIGASLEQVDVDNEADERKYALLSASYRVMPKLTLASTFGYLKDVVPNAAANPDGIDGKGLTVGAFYEVLPKLTVYAAARGVRLDSEADTETFAIGASYSFQYDLLK